MARIYAHEVHFYTHFDDTGKRSEYVFPRGEWREVPDDVAEILVKAHPQKLVRLGPGEDRPPEPEPPEPYQTAVMSEPPADRMARPRTRRK